MQNQNNHHQHPNAVADSDLPPLSTIKVHSSSPRFPPPTTPLSTETPTAGAQRRIGIAVDLSDESAFTVKWAVRHYLRPGDAVILVHVRPTSVLYGADWGSGDLSIVDTDSEESQKKLEDDFDAFTATKASDLAQPLAEAQIPYKIHIVKDHDMKERLCLEVERLGLSAVITGSRGFGATKRENNDRLGSVSDYCVRHCVCPVVVVRYPNQKDSGNARREPMVSVSSVSKEEDQEGIKSTREPMVSVASVSKEEDQEGIKSTGEPMVSVASVSKEEDHEGIKSTGEPVVSVASEEEDQEFHDATADDR